MASPPSSSLWTLPRPSPTPRVSFCLARTPPPSLGLAACSSWAIQSAAPTTSPLSCRKEAAFYDRPESPPPSYTFCAAGMRA
eukprot:6559089-Prorocentrum_lima.AAC.1